MRTQTPSKREKHNWSKMGVQGKKEFKKGSREIQSKIHD